MEFEAVVTMEGYGGRAGSFQFDERVIDGIRSEDVWKRIQVRCLTGQMTLREARETIGE
jgi:hypothetical protein